MTQTNVRLTEEVISIVKVEQDKVKGTSFTQAINNLILRASRYDEKEINLFIKNQDKLNRLLTSLIETEGEDVKLIPKKNGRRPKKISIEGKVYESVKKAVISLGISQSAISQKIKTSPETCFYIEENE